MRDDVGVYLDQVRDLGCGSLLEWFVGRIQALAPRPEGEAGAYGLRFSQRGQQLCEISVFGELFVVRIGQERSIEFRVRTPAVAGAAFDALLCESVVRRARTLDPLGAPAPQPDPPEPSLPASDPPGNPL